MSRSLRVVALACALCGAAMVHSPVWAAAGAESAIEHLTFTLVDLAPADGIDPSYAIVGDPRTPNRLRTELTVNVENTPLGEVDGSIQTQFSFMAPMTLTRSVTGNQADAASTATSISTHVLSQARGLASAFAESDTNIYYADSFGIRLSPMTALVITADATVTAFDQGHAGALDHAFEFAQAAATLRVRAADAGDGNGPQDSLSTRSTQTFVDGAADALDQSGVLSVSFQNLGATDDLYGYLSLRATASAYGVSPVPEPSTALLAAAGLAALGLGRRRRLS